MQRMISLLTTGLALAFTPVAVSADMSGRETQHLEHLVVENADTPAEHQALARYYRMKAADATSLAEEHRAMGGRYNSRPGHHGKPGEVRNMKKHCDRIAELNTELATEYEGLAKGEEAAAKE